jgi:glycosyltransferase involved in cell wall biosynthesis
MPDKIFINGKFLTQKLTGVQRYAYEMVKHLLAQGANIKIIVPPKPIFEAYDIKGWPIVKCGFWRGPLWEQIELPLFLRSKKINGKRIVLLNLCNTAPFFFSKNILTIHDLSFLENPQWFKKSFVIYYRFLIPRLIKKSELVLTVSQFSKTIIEKFYPFSKGKVEVIYNASCFSPVNSATNHCNILGKYKLVKNKYLLSVCSLEPRKNLNNLVKAFNKLETDIDLVLVGGKGDVFSNVLLNVKEKKQIKQIGYITDQELQALYHNALCFIYPSFYEGFGLPPLEAMTNACPVIVSKIPSLKEVCGDAAIYINPLSISHIIQSIETLIHDESLRERHRNAGLIQEKKFSWSTSATKLINLLSQSVNS